MQLNRNVYDECSVITIGISAGSLDAHTHAVLSIEAIAISCACSIGDLF